MLKQNKSNIERIVLLLYSVLLHVFIIAANKQCESDLVWDVMETVLLNMHMQD